MGNQHFPAATYVQSYLTLIYCSRLQLDLTDIPLCSCTVSSCSIYTTAAGSHIWQQNKYTVIFWLHNGFEKSLQALIFLETNTYEYQTLHNWVLMYFNVH